MCYGSEFTSRDLDLSAPFHYSIRFDKGRDVYPLAQFLPKFIAARGTTYDQLSFETAPPDVGMANKGVSLWVAVFCSGFSVFLCQS